MPFDDDVRGKDFRADPEFFTRPAVTIRASGPTHLELGERVIELVTDEKYPTDEDA